MAAEHSYPDVASPRSPSDAPVTASIDFTYDAPGGRVIFGVAAARQRLAGEIERLGGTRVLLLASERQRVLAEALTRPLGPRIAGVFCEISPHVPAAGVRRARSVAGAADADCLLAIGGGSTIGMAKAIALQRPLPIVAVPTTYAGSEMTAIWGITEASRKVTGRSRDVLPRAVVYDPQLTFGLPWAITAASAMNAMAHAVEALYAPNANPISSLLAGEAVRSLGRGVMDVMRAPKDPSARAETLYGAYLAGASLGAAGTSVHHQICHVLGGAYDLPHADTHAIVLPQAVAFIGDAAPAAMSVVARALGAQEAATGLFDLLGRLGIPTSLREIGMREDAIDEAVELVLLSKPEGPRRVSKADLRVLLENAYRGARPSPSSGDRPRVVGRRSQQL